MPTSSSRAAEALDTAGVDHLLGYLLALAEVPTRKAFQRQIGQRFSLRPVEFTLLMLLRDNGHALPKQIGPALRLPAPHVSTLVDRLVARGLVQRSRHPGDGRAVRVELTAAGQQLVRRVGPLSLSMEEGLRAVLDDTERAQLRALLLKLAQAA